MNNYIELTKKYPIFNYNKFNISIDDKRLTISFNFDNGEYSFIPSSSWKFNNVINPRRVNINELSPFVFNIGMIELISYWKATCSGLVNIYPAFINDFQSHWWRNLYYNGLGEFFYKNNINVNIDEFMHLGIKNFDTLPKQNFRSLQEKRVLVPIGGGKDSIVTLELLKKADFEVIPLIINPNAATLRIIDIAMIPRANIIEIHREIDPTLLELNKKGFLNGHTPFSAMLAFYSFMSAYIIGAKYIALSNEFSANESTIINSNVNHQYSKTISFESDFRYYTKMFLNNDIEYFSFIRPLHELQVAKLFSHYPQYFTAFRSCNVGSKDDKWCGNCPKCLFVALMLALYINHDELENIFGKDIFSNLELKNTLEELLGLKMTKPFECIGTVDEVRAVVNQLTTDEYYSKKPLFANLTPLPAPSLKTIEESWNDIHFLPLNFKKILKKEFNLKVE